MAFVEPLDPTFAASQSQVDVWFYKQTSWIRTKKASSRLTVIYYSILSILFQHFSPFGP